jgi:hypothetical protein
MPVAQLGLFHPTTIKNAMRAAPVPADLDARRALLLPWAQDLQAGTLDGRREISVDRAYFITVFAQVLGYHFLEHRTTAHVWDVDVQGKPNQGQGAMDGAIGWFSSSGVPRVHAVIEAKRSTQGLDESGGRAMTPVQQAWDYANRVGTARWILVTNFRELRLYSRAQPQHLYERFFLTELAQDPDAFARFVFLLSRESLLPNERGGQSRLDALLVASEQEQREITDALYADYRRLRVALFADLRRDNPAVKAPRVLAATQKLLDRVLFIAFAEDRQLLPDRVLRSTLAADHYIVDVPVIRSLRSLFQKIDRGDLRRGIPPLNGGLFAEDDLLDTLEISDETCRRLEVLGGYDFESAVNVEVLGHIFEQSISDLEALRAEARGEAVEGVGSRKRQGVFYTPSAFTRYIAERTLHPLFTRLRDRVWSEVSVNMDPKAKGGARMGLDELAAEVSRREERLGAPNAPKNARSELARVLALYRSGRATAWGAYRDALQGVRVLDPACGSGAFLVAAFDVLAEEYNRCNREIEAATGQPGVFDVDQTVLQHNLFGVDLNRESVETTKLSLWLKTARRDRSLTYLDGNVQVGNSVVHDPTAAPLAFDWSTGRQAGDALDPEADTQAAAIDARWRDGFDAVIGNPPYVRQEWISEIKPHLAQHYKAWHGMADLFVYFFERGLSVLKPEGRLGFIVANKWLKAGYAEPLRGLLVEGCLVEEVLDFGHAPVFPDADAFPSVVILQRRPPGVALPQDAQVRAAQPPREELRDDALPELIERFHVFVPQARLSAAPWSLEPPEIAALMERLRERGVPLREFAGAKPYRGVLTGLNEAFLIDAETREKLINADPTSAELIKPYLRGENVERWFPNWPGKYMIFARRGVDIHKYPAILEHLLKFRAQLEPKPDDWTGGVWPGRKPGKYEWFELQDSIAYHALFERPKICYSDITWRPSFCAIEGGMYSNNTTYILPGEHPWLLAVLNSAVMWSYLWRHAQHGKDEALRLFSDFVETLPIPTPSAEVAAAAAERVAELTALTRAQAETNPLLLNWLKFGFGVKTPPRSLGQPMALSTEAFVAEVTAAMRAAKRRVGPLDAPQLAQEHAQYAAAQRQRAARILVLEREVCALVISAWGLGAEDVELLRRTAPPRTPTGLPLSR